MPRFSTDLAYNLALRIRNGRAAGQDGLLLTTAEMDCVEAMILISLREEGARIEREMRLDESIRHQARSELREEEATPGSTDQGDA